MSAMLAPIGLQNIRSQQIMLPLCQDATPAQHSRRGRGRASGQVSRQEGSAMCNNSHHRTSAVAVLMICRGIFCVSSAAAMLTIWSLCYC